MDLVMYPNNRLRGLSGLSGASAAVAAFLATDLGRQVREYLLAQFQGLSSDFILANINKVEIRTAYTPPLAYSASDIIALIKPRSDVTEDAAAAAAADSRPSVIQKVKPTVIITLKSGEKVFAPYGAVSADIWRVNRRNLYLMIGAGLLALAGLGYFLGYKRGRKHSSI